LDVRLVLATLSLVLLVVTAGCGGGQGSPGGSGKLETLSSVDQFQHAFDDATGHPRLVLLLSPT
jgi:hypothetical protein